jgi:hypothetical protein
MGCNPHRQGVPPEASHMIRDHLVNKRWKTSRVQKFHHSVYVILLDDASTLGGVAFRSMLLVFLSSLENAFDGKI